MSARYSAGEILLASLFFTSQTGFKRRPVLVLRDPDDDDLLVLPVTSHAVRSPSDISLMDWQQAGLRLPSVVRAEKLATIAKSAVLHPLGKISANDQARVRAELPKLFQTILAEW